MAKEKRYPIIEEEENIGMCQEPMVEYSFDNSIDVAELEEDEPWMSDDYDPGIGPYTMEELNARIDEADAAIDRAEQGDWSDWVTSEEMDSELYKKYPWLLL